MPRWFIGMLGFAGLFAASVILLHGGVYGLLVLLVLPYALGAFTCWVFRPVTRAAATWYGFSAILAACALMVICRVDGVICVLLSLPLTAPLCMAGARHVFRNLFERMAMLLLIPASLVYDTHAKPPVYVVTTSIEIAAPPERVWDRIIHLSQMPEPSEWYFRAGLAYPTQARIEGTGPGATRVCEFSTGPVVEQIEVWDAPRVLRFRVTQNPAPMREWSLYGEISPKHLHGYLISREGEFRLTPLAGNRTLLEGTSWYQHGLWPAPYWRLWSNAVIHRIHLRVFRQIKALSEPRSPGSDN